MNVEVNYRKVSLMDMRPEQVFEFVKLVRDNPVEWEQARLSLFDEYMGRDKRLITHTLSLIHI